MLNMQSVARSSQRAPDAFAGGADLAFLLDIAKRQWRIIAIITAAFVALSVAYLITAVPRYTAKALMLIDTHKNQLLQSQQVYGEATLDAGQVESQVEVLKSEGTAAAVVKDFKLWNDPEFVGSGGGLMGALFSSVGLATPPTQEELTQTATANLMHAISAKRVGLTYVIEIGVTSTSPTKAAKLANGVTEAYSLGELEANFTATKRTTRWLKDRIDELREQANAADRQVQAFKVKNNIVETNRGLMGDQQLSELNSALIQARAVTAEAKARLDRIDAISKGGDPVPNATITDALRNDVITRLRAQYLDLSAREANISQRYGVDHSAAVNLRSQMAELKRSINNEIQRIAETFKSDYEIAHSREVSLQSSLNQLVSSNQVTAQAQVQSRDLDSTASTYRNMYESFLQKFQVATQQQSFPVTDARVITPASVPGGKSSPKTNLVLGGGLLLGFCAGCVAAFAREKMDASFRNASEVEQRLSVACLGILPRLDDDRRLGDMPTHVSRYAIDAPLSRFAETIRSLKVSIDLARISREVKVIGVASSLPQEGKTTVAANLAMLLARTGNRTLLLDGDLRNPSMTRLLAPSATTGLIEVLGRKVSAESAIKAESEVGVDFLPAVIDTPIPHTSDLVSSTMMSDLLRECSSRYDYVIVDYPPMLSVVDVRAAAHLCDAFIVVVEWGRTTQAAVQEALSSSGLGSDQILGVVLNKADPRALRHHESYKGANYGKYYSEMAL